MARSVVLIATPMQSNRNTQVIAGLAFLLFPAIFATIGRPSAIASHSHRSDILKSLRFGGAPTDLAREKRIPC
ncbi:MAG: hypothetical protein M0Z99_00240 [Betaproteobacteria bacterium]|nr:hypothetical protein [Betaproteobacteria bacterium]